MFLIDTCVLSELSRPQPNSRVVEWLKEQEELVVSTMSLQELSFGVKRRSSPKLTHWFAELLPALTVLSVTRETSLMAGEFQAASEKAGLQLADADAIIAATAAVTGRILLTRNLKDFAHCPLTLKNPFV